MAGLVSCRLNSWRTGFSSVNGTGIAASFNQFAGAAVDAGGTLYVAEYYGYLVRLIK